MRVNLFIESDISVFDFDAIKVGELVSEKFEQITKCPYETCCDITVVDDAEMAQINKNTRGIDGSTDVLSFPAVEYDIPGNYLFADSDDLAFEPDTGELLLGDIIINADKVVSQSEEFGHSKEREFAFLMTHSLLHLIGYDHMEDEEREEMEEMQRKILSECKIHR